MTPAKSTKTEETQCNKPDPDTSSWLRTFLITNSCLRVTRPATQHEAVQQQQQLSASPAFHFQGRSFSQCPLEEHPGLLCKSNSYFNTGPTHLHPDHLQLIRSVPPPPPSHVSTRSEDKQQSCRSGSEQPTPVSRTVWRAFFLAMPRRSRPIVLSFTEETAISLWQKLVKVFLSCLRCII